MQQKPIFYGKRFIINTLIVSIWVNISEVFRYFVIVLPQTRKYLSSIPGVTPIDLPVLIIWGCWDMLLTALIVFMFWLFAQNFGKSLSSIFISASISWAFFFVLFWVGMLNMGLTKPSLLLTALPLAWIEVVVASFIAAKLYEDKGE